MIIGEERTTTNTPADLRTDLSIGGNCPVVEQVPDICPRCRRHSMSAVILVSGFDDQREDETGNDAEQQHEGEKERKAQLPCLPLFQTGQNFEEMSLNLYILLCPPL